MNWFSIVVMCLIYLLAIIWLKSGITYYKTGDKKNAYINLIFSIAIMVTNTIGLLSSIFGG